MFFREKGMTRERLGVKQKVKKVYANLTCHMVMRTVYM